MLIVSRDIPALRGLTRLKLDPDNHDSVQSDIGRFIAYEVAQLSQTHNLDPQFCTKIERDLLRRSEGTFLWVGFAMQELARQSTSNQIQNALASLPHGLNSTYSRILMQIKESDRRQTALLLQLTAIAVRPLTIAELASLIGNDESPEVPAERATLDAIALCANILRRDDDQVTFVHLSAKEYLQKQLPILMNNQPGLRTFYISAEDAQLYLAEACVITIEGSSFQDNKLFESLDENSEDDATVSDNWSLANCNSDAETDSDDHEDLYQFEPLLEYATLYWFRHAAYLNTKSSQLYNHQRPFFGEHSVTRANWLRAYIYHRSYRGQSLSQDSNLLIVSARFNVLNLAMALLIDPRGSYISRWLTRLSRSFDSAQTATLNEALCVACAEGHRAFANALLQMGADPNGHGYTESTPLAAAASLGRTSIVQLLADNGLDTSQEEYLAYHRKAFCNAASQGNNRLVRLYLGEIPDEQKGRQQPGQPPSSDLLPPSGDQNQMKNVVDIDVKDTYGRTPLQLAAMYGHTGVVQFLLDKGANVEGALHMAVASNRVSIVRMVLSRHRDCNVFDEDHNTPLHLAVRIPSYDIVCCLLKQNASFLLRNRQNLTPLQVAATLGNAEAVALFFDRRPSNQVEDAIWIDAMGRAASRGYGNVVTVLLARRVPPDLKDGSGITALQNAASEGSEQVVKLLLNGGAAIDALDNSGETALFFATQYSRQAVVKTLLQYGADVTITNPEGWTALMFAIQGGDVGIQALLLSKGAVLVWLTTNVWPLRSVD
ncbi:receptor-interacting serine/threonine-protein kinase [Verticillium alfalfae VaMs.102]|uniref:Receptor-interacting serine/threonine-protein kinase n=1 Tax=Verticillium alfalfae (strain VaMs.102 / ATCC MYA-4576 / FGSC 10136) TaxID=526221 RepID=C9SBH7_VERA1|nr:receptor-interacting serine/threonine-protein kinase [Verticillium alfalfae VaMs.102]EEY15711.1 receptor-interacting serine/threonine-protein kinase [Verticillium alfalfae VaMs.102]